MSSKRFSIFLFAVTLLMLCGCSESAAGSNPSTQPVRADLILATTTSTQDSGLLDLLNPIFQKNSGYIVKTIAVGTGKALQMAAEGNADVLLVHAPEAEKELMDAGFGSERLLLMHNDFVIVGPASDPAKIKGLQSINEVLSKIYNSEAIFVSRGDDSGTHKKELALWANADIIPEDEWYLESGQGMGATLRIASEKSAYTLVDRGTYLALSDNLDLDVFIEGHPSLLNVYHVVIVNPDRWPNVNYEGAKSYANFLISDEVQKLIGEFGIDQYGQPLFFPDADKTEAELGIN